LGLPYLFFFVLFKAFIPLELAVRLFGWGSIAWCCALHGNGILYGSYLTKETPAYTLDR
jgi:hypothetical protein